MNEALKTQISAFIDGELPENETELLLRRLSQDAAMRQQVARYLSIGRLMRRDTDLPGMHELRTRIAMALGAEPAAEHVDMPPGGTRLIKPAVGLAVAASVAVLGLVGLRQVMLPDVATVPAGDVSASSEPVRAITQPDADDVLSEELRHMYLRHSTTQGDFGSNSMLTRLVTLELQGGELVEVAPQDRPAPAAAAEPDTEPESQDTAEDAGTD